MTKAIEDIKQVREVPGAFIPPSSLPLRWENDPSSLIPAKGIAPITSSSKPTLSSPVHRTLNNFVTKAEPTFSKYTAIQQKELESLLEKIHTFQREETAQMDKVEQAKQEVSFWGMISDLGSVVTSACSIYFGTAAVSAGAAPVGGALIASGVLSISNLVFKYGGVWNYLADQVAEKDTQLHHTFTSYIPTSIGLSAAAVGAYGSYYSWQLASASGINQVKSILSTVGSLTTGLSHFAMGISQSNLSFANKELSFLRSNNQFTTMDFENLSQDVKEYIEKQLKLHKTLSEIVKETENIIQEIQQPV